MELRHAPAADDVGGVQVLEQLPEHGARRAVQFVVLFDHLRSQFQVLKQWL